MPLQNMPPLLVADSQRLMLSEKENTLVLDKNSGEKKTSCGVKVGKNVRQPVKSLLSDRNELVADRESGNFDKKTVIKSSKLKKLEKNHFEAATLVFDTGHGDFRFELSHVCGR